MTRYVLLAGAWHSESAWDRVSALLRARGHEVCAPALAGLGSRVAELSPRIGLHEHAEDVVTAIEESDWDDIVLVGHSYAGFVARQAADRVSERIRRIVLLDGWAGQDGDSIFAIAPQSFIDRMQGAAVAHGDGWRVPPAPPARFGVTDPSDVDWLTARLSDHPLRTFQEPTVLTGRADDVPTSAIATDAELGIPFLDWYAERGWPVARISSGHDPMVTAPEALADLFEHEPVRTGSVVPG